MSPAARIPSLDGLRAVSIALVLVSHAARHGAPKWITDYVSGALGVLIFFVISGFLITSLLLREMESGRVSFANFFLRRAVRLGPANLAFIATLYLLTRTTPLQMSGCQFITALTYTKNYACGTWVDGHLWSLSVEEQFYLFWPFAVALLPRRSLLALALLLITISPVSRAIEYMHGARSFFWLTSNADCLMIGCLAAMLFEAPVLNSALRWRPPVGRSLAIIALCIPIWLSAQLKLGALNTLFGHSIQALAAAYLLLSLIKIKSGILFKVLNLHFVSAVGVLSYSIYLWQQLFFAEADTFGPAGAWLLRHPFDLIGAVSAGAASYLLIERPLLKWRAKLRRVVNGRSPGAQPLVQPNSAV